MTLTLKVVLNAQRLRGVTVYLPKSSLVFVAKRGFILKKGRKQTHIISVFLD